MNEKERLQKAVEKFEKAAQAYRKTAREQYGCDDINIDSDAGVSFADEGVWVQAWVWLQDEDEDNS